MHRKEKKQKKTKKLSDFQGKFTMLYDFLDNFY